MFMHRYYEPSISFSRWLVQFDDYGEFTTAILLIIIEAK